MLVPPEYIKGLEIADAPITYTWNDTDPGSIHRQDERLATFIAKISDRGVVALSCGFAEWIAWRLHKHGDVLPLLNEIEALWAAIVDWQYLAPLNRVGATPRMSEWQGPVRGPICSAFYLLGDVAFRARKRAYSAEASTCLSALAAHILPNPKPFLEWRKQVIQRLSAAYPFVLSDRLGPPVPREILDPNVVVEPTVMSELPAQFIRSLDYTRNPFLRSPQEMIADAFEGTPYER